MPVKSTHGVSQLSRYQHSDAYGGADSAPGEIFRCAVPFHSPINFAYLPPSGRNRDFAIEKFLKTDIAPLAAEPHIRK
jgi:hypothetical protein